MQILFAISVLCFLGIFWAAIAGARHIKAGQRQNLSIVPSHSDYKHHLPAASETAQELVPASRIVVDTPLARKPAAPPDVSVPRTRHTDLNQSVRDLAVNKQWTLPTHVTRMQRLTSRAVQPAKPAPSPSTSLRTPPQPARHGTMELLDPTYFNKDMGDLTGPYRPPRISANDRRKPAPPTQYWQS
jgi:hypothetical protein